MITETVRMLATWLADDTYGVNALLPSVPRDTGITEPPAVKIKNSTESGATARGQIPDQASDLPALLVTPADMPIDDVSPMVAPWPADGSCVVLIRYVTRKAATAVAENHTSTTLRAVKRSLRQLVLGNESARLLAEVQLVGITAMQTATLYEENQDTVVTGGVLVTCRVRDTWATA